MSAQVTIQVTASHPREAAARMREWADLLDGGAVGERRASGRTPQSVPTDGPNARAWATFRAAMSDDGRLVLDEFARRGGEANLLDVARLTGRDPVNAGQLLGALQRAAGGRLGDHLFSKGPWTKTSDGEDDRTYFLNPRFVTAAGAA